MEEKSKGACTRSTTREKEESQGSTARGDAAALQKELQQAQPLQQVQPVQQVQQVQQQQAEQLGSTQRQRKQRPLPTASCCGWPVLRPISEQLAKKHRVLAALLAALSPISQYQYTSRSSSPLAEGPKI